MNGAMKDVGGSRIRRTEPKRPGDATWPSLIPQLNAGTAGSENGLMGIVFIAKVIGGESEMKITAIIQVRMGSTRLPCKAMLSLAGKPALWHMLERVSNSQYVDEIVVATTQDQLDNRIGLLQWEMQRDVDAHSNWKIHRGPIEVMERMLGCVEAAGMSGADVIVELTGDCPMVDPRHIDDLIGMYMQQNSRIDVVTNVNSRTWPDGLDILIFSREALERINRIEKDPVLRNHVGWNMLQYPELFTTLNWLAPEEYHWPELRLTLDTAEDYVFLSHMFDKFYTWDKPFQVEDIIKYLRKHSEEVTNKNVRRKKPEEG